jgi:hypothetical protein
MKKKMLKEECKQMSTLLPVRYSRMAVEIQTRVGDVSLSQVWRKALDIGLAQLIKDTPAKPDTEPRP